MEELRIKIGHCCWSADTANISIWCPSWNVLLSFNPRSLGQSLELTLWRYWIMDTQPVPTGASADDVSTLISMLDTFTQRQVNPSYECYLFRKRTQASGESVETFTTDLKTMSKICEVPDTFLDNFIKDQIIFGLRDNALRECLLQEKDLTLAKCIEMSLAAEAASSHLKAMTCATQDADVIHITKKTRGHARKAPRSPWHRPQTCCIFLCCNTPWLHILWFESSPCEVSMPSMGIRPAQPVGSLTILRGSVMPLIETPPDPSRRAWTTKCATYIKSVVQSRLTVNL